MTELFRIRRNQTVLWLGITASLWLIYRQLLGDAGVLALLVAAAIVAGGQVLLLLVFRGETLLLSERLATLGGLLASLYGHDDK